MCMEKIIFSIFNYYSSMAKMIIFPEESYLVGVYFWMSLEMTVTSCFSSLWLPVADISDKSSTVICGLFPQHQTVWFVCVTFSSLVFLPKLTQSGGGKCNKRGGWTGTSTPGETRAAAQASSVSHPVMWLCIVSLCSTVLCMYGGDKSCLSCRVICRYCREFSLLW
jgi:hypothetical protein